MHWADEQDGFRIRNGIIRREGKNRIATLAIEPVHYFSGGEYKRIRTELVPHNGRFVPEGISLSIGPSGEAYFPEYKHSHLTIGMYDYKPGKWSQIVAFGDSLINGNIVEREAGDFIHQQIVHEKGRIKEQVIVAKNPDISGQFLMIGTRMDKPFAFRGQKKKHYLTPKGLWVFNGEAWDSAGKKVKVIQFVEEVDGAPMLFSGVRKEWLDKAEFPVTIDPTYSVQPDAAAGVDNYFWPDDHTPNGTSNYIYQGYWAIIGDGACYGAVYFDLSSIPAKSQVTSSTIYLWRYDGTDGTGVSLRRWTGSWDESSAWADMPTSDPTNIGGGDWDDQPNAMSVTAAAQNWIDGTWTNYGIRTNKGGPNYSGKSYYSSDHATAGTRPKFEVVYTVPSRNFTVVT